MSLSTDQFIELLSGGRETRGVEFKAAGPRGDPLVFAFEARAILAMSNLQLGGWVLLGRRVRERQCCCLPRRARVRDDGQVACLYRVIPQLQVPLVARPATKRLEARGAYARRPFLFGCGAGFEPLAPVASDDLRQVSKCDDGPETNLSRPNQSGRDPCSQVAKYGDDDEGHGERRVPSISGPFRQPEAEQSRQAKTERRHRCVVGRCPDDNCRKLARGKP